MPTTWFLGNFVWILCWSSKSVAIQGRNCWLLAKILATGMSIIYLHGKVLVAKRKYQLINQVGSHVCTCSNPRMSSTTLASTTDLKIHVDWLTPSQSWSLHAHPSRLHFNFMHLLPFYVPSLWGEVCILLWDHKKNSKCNYLHKFKFI